MVEQPFPQLQEEISSSGLELPLNLITSDQMGAFLCSPVTQYTFMIYPSSGLPVPSHGCRKSCSCKTTSHTSRRPIPGSVVACLPFPAVSVSPEPFETWLLSVPPLLHTFSLFESRSGLVRGVWRRVFGSRSPAAIMRFLFWTLLFPFLCSPGFCRLSATACYCVPALVPLPCLNFPPLLRFCLLGPCSSLVLASLHEFRNTPGNRVSCKRNVSPLILIFAFLVY